MSMKRNPDTLRAANWKQKLKVRFLSNHLKQFPVDEKTLDIGCGWGFSLQINPNFWCVDADEAAIKHLQGLGAKAFQCDIAEPLPFEDGFFDNAFTHDVLEHLEEAEMINLFAEARRVIKKGGIFMNIVPNYKGFLIPDIGHKRFVQLGEIKSAAEQTGFEVIDNWHTPLPATFSEVWNINKLVTVSRAV